MNDAHTLRVTPRGLNLDRWDTDGNDPHFRLEPEHGRYVLNSEHLLHTRSHLELLASLWNDQGLRLLMRPDQAEKIAAALGLQGSYAELINDTRRVVIDPC